MAAKTFYLLASKVSSHQALSESAPSDSTQTLGWNVGQNAANNSAPFQAGTELVRTSGLWSTSINYPNGTIDTSDPGDCWRSTDPLTGLFVSGNWQCIADLIAVTNGGAFDGWVGFRIFKSANADGSGATEITSARQQGSTVTNLATGAAQQSSVTFNPGAFSLNNEYLFIQVGVEITGAGSNNNADANFRIGATRTRIITSDFVPPASVSGGATFGALAASGTLTVESPGGGGGSLPTTGNVSNAVLQTGLNSSNPLVWSHNHAAGSDSVLYAFIWSVGNNESRRTYTAVTRNGQSFTRIGFIDAAEGSQLSVWRLVNPSTGAHNISAVTSDGDTNDAHGAAVSGYGVHQATPENDSDIGKYPPADSATRDVATTVDNCLLLFGVSSFEYDGSNWSLGGGQTEIIRVDADLGDFRHMSMSTKEAVDAGAQSCTMSWEYEWGPLSALVAVAPVDAPAGAEITGDAQLQPLSASGNIGIETRIDGVVSFGALAASGTATVAVTAGGNASLQPIAASGAVAVAVQLSGAVEFAPLSASGALAVDIRVQGTATFGAIQGSGQIATPRNITGVAAFSPLAATGAVVVPVRIEGIASFGAITAQGSVAVEDVVSAIEGAALFAPLTASGSVAVEVRIAGNASLQPLTATGTIVELSERHISGAVSFGAIAASGYIRRTPRFPAGVRMAPSGTGISIPGSSATVSVRSGNTATTIAPSTTNVRVK